ncbi:hypothetical protein MW887_005952 [Aspergillus wentii]|nr:hypothetical protein MW887_005952 [Aspergillus wentii]
MNATVVELAQRAATSCPIEGNPDLYGLGIRLGLYLQMFTAQISGLSSAILPIPDSIGQGVVLFVLATGIVLFRLTEHREIEAVEVFIMLSLLVAHHGACRVPFWKQPMTIFVYLGELVCLLALSAWFWFRGMDMLPRSCVDDYAFFFAKVSIWHWFRKLNQAFIVITIVGAAPGIIYYMSWLFTLTVLRIIYGQQVDEDHEMATGSLEFVINTGVIAYVELAIKWNHISGVYDLSSPGQYMPFFIALAQLFTTLYQLGKHGLIQEYAGDGGGDFECPHKTATTTDVELAPTTH